jgi:hypothetical protein
VRSRKSFHAFCLGAVVAAKVCTVVFETVAQDSDVAMAACWRKRVDRAFESVEIVGLASHDNLKSLVVIISAVIVWPV